MLHGPEGRDGAGQHHPFDAQVEDARALGEELAHGGEHQRRAVEDRRRGKHDDDAVVHVHDGAAASRALNDTRYRRSSSPPRAKNRIIPCRTPTNPAGNSGPCTHYPALARPPRKNPTTATPTGLYRA